MPRYLTCVTAGEAITLTGSSMVDAVLDSGECGTTPTTVVDFSSGEAEVLRHGAGDTTRFD
jgi:tRNA A37 threonylcarbamoyladenosine synthetase subunit TsaC/SUA5/YrdC